MNANSQRKFGIRYYEAFSKRNNVLSPVKNEIGLLDICINRPHTKGEKVYLEMMKFALGKMTYRGLWRN